MNDIEKYNNQLGTRTRVTTILQHQHQHTYHQQQQEQEQQQQRQQQELHEKQQHQHKHISGNGNNNIKTTTTQSFLHFTALMSFMRVHLLHFNYYYCPGSGLVADSIIFVVEVLGAGQSSPDLAFQRHSQCLWLVWTRPVLPFNLYFNECHMTH